MQLPARDQHDNGHNRGIDDKRPRAVAGQSDHEQCPRRPDDEALDAEIDCTAEPAMSPKSSRAPFAVTDTVKTMPTAITHIGMTKVQDEGTPNVSPAIRSAAPRSNMHMPRRRLPEVPHRETNRSAKRAVMIITIATVAKARLNCSSEYPALSISTRGEVEKNTKNVPMAALKPRV